MLISYDIEGNGARRGWSKPLLLLACVNGIFAASMISAWTVTSLFIADPIEWATWMRIYRTGSIMELFDYPFVLLWLLPVSGIATAWVAGQSRNWSLAYGSLTLPIVVLGFCVGWFYLAPEAWR
ncbi:MAG: hypothetical protein ACKVP7_15765 [Hyphomicrobiaceae bacterium]